MSDEIPKAYEPTSVETKWFARWTERGAFHADENSAAEGYAIVIPPPNVTGVLTLGHVLNTTIQDILCRRQRQRGKEVLWLPGTDHAGIATQAKVEAHLRETENKTRRDYGREAFLEKVWEWKEKHGGIIIDQLKKLGCSCDWERERFTMDEDYSRRVADCFVHLFKQGLIYRGKRMVNWCPASRTALSDEEVIMTPQRSVLYTMRYEIAEEPGEYVEIATTRPETLMGDTGVAVHPDDKRYKHLLGKHAVRPFPRAEIPFVADEHIDPEFGTGVLKVTPAHDKADFEIGEKNGLEIIDVLNADGTLNAHAGEEFAGMDRFVGRKAAVAKLKEMGLLVREEDYENNVGISERGGVPIEPRISMQWFLRYPQVERSTAAVAKREIRFRPERWAKTYAHWMENIQDWCISRQLWWGHQIPVWYRKERAEELQSAESLDKETAGDDLHVGVEAPADPENWVRDEDVLDTWFSSWLWPFATMDDPTLKKFYPTDDLVTGPDIIFFWVARMIMAGYEFEDRKPFSNVFFTSIIRDKKGRKLSKSLGNSPDPLDLIAKYGADALRFSIMRIAPTGQDLRFLEDEKDGETIHPQVVEGRNFANKLWNGARYRQMQGAAAAPVGGQESRFSGDALSIYDIDILARLDQLKDDLDRAYETYKFNDGAQLLYDFFWSQYCDWYLESIKNRLRDDADASARATTLAVVDTVLERFLPLLHPYMPHISEDLWEKLGFAQDGRFLMNTAYPEAPALDGIDGSVVSAAREQAAAVYTAVGRARNLKAEYNLASNKKVRFIIEAAADWVAEQCDTLRLLCGAGEVVCDGDYLPSAGTPTLLTDLGKIFMPLEGLVDLDAERIRLGKEVGKVEKDLKLVTAKLSNSKFTENAPKEIVEENKERREKLKNRLEQLKEMVENVG